MSLWSEEPFSNCPGLSTRPKPQIKAQRSGKTMVRFNEIVKQGEEGGEREKPHCQSWSHSKGLFRISAKPSQYGQERSGRTIKGVQRVLTGPRCGFLSPCIPPECQESHPGLSEPGAFDLILSSDISHSDKWLCAAC
ncbi:hypothetical protein WMY93_029997 [Mugilogobius chulae]|uniref:Uncharacterized protein n=1 Tax=Mugilogobius chulae TaxID=88201 RepID=A0AAW0MTB3_9GOBI